jgi:hypothetical protein
MTLDFLAISLMAQLAIAAGQSPDTSSLILRTRALENFTDNMTTGATSSVECNLCQAAVNTIVSQVKENATEDAIAGKIEAICVNLTESSQEENCWEFADRLTPVLINFLEEAVNAEEVCVLAELC